jgi:hypothetical protein
MDRQPGVSRREPLSGEGLARLQAHLECGSQISDAVLSQWIRRYGDAARTVIRQHGRYTEALEP